MNWGAAGDPFEVVLAGGEAIGSAMAEAVALAGGRIVARRDWRAPFGDTGALLVIDLCGLGTLDDLPDMAAADVIACDLDQLDAVADAALLTDAQLLCDPSLAERIAALAIAASEAIMPGGVREGEAARLTRFSAEVGRIAAVLARLAIDESGAALADRRPTFDAGPPDVAAMAIDTDPDAGPNPTLVRQAIRARRLRATFLGEGLFEDPAWDMLLDLFAAELEGGRVSVSSLCIAAQVAPTTALRWIGRLSDAGLFERRPDPRDKRRAFMALTARGSAAMRRYAAALERAGLALR